MNTTSITRVPSPPPPSSALFVAVVFFAAESPSGQKAFCFSILYPQTAARITLSRVRGRVGDDVSNIHSSQSVARARSLARVLLLAAPRQEVPNRLRSLPHAPVCVCVCVLYGDSHFFRSSTTSPNTILCCGCIFPPISLNFNRIIRRHIT